LNNIIENYKNFDQKTRENNKKSKENGPNWNHYYHWKKSDLIWTIKLQAIKTLIKKKKRNKKLKVKGLNWNILYI
jgi:hypothetical protein